MSFSVYTTFLSSPPHPPSRQYIPSAGAFTPIAQMTKAFPALSYQLFFEDHTPEAILELGKNTTRTLRATMRTVDSPPPQGFLKSDHSYLAPYDHIDPIPPIPFFTAEEEDYLVEQYAIQGFRNSKFLATSLSLYSFQKTKKN